MRFVAPFGGGRKSLQGSLSRDSTSPVDSLQSVPTCWSYSRESDFVHTITVYLPSAVSAYDNELYYNRIIKRYNARPKPYNRLSRRTTLYN